MLNEGREVKRNEKMGKWGVVWKESKDGDGRESWCRRRMRMGRERKGTDRV